jgi:hypothetical protein
MSYLYTRVTISYLTHVLINFRATYLGEQSASICTALDEVRI